MATNGSPELLIVMGAGATADQTEHVLARLQEAGVAARVQRGREATVIGAIGERELLATLPLEGYPGVEQVVPILKPYKLVARDDAPLRRLQAAHLAVHLPGARRRRVDDPAGGARGDWAAGRD